MEGAHHRGEMEVYAEMAADDEEGLVLFAGVTLPLRWAVGSMDDGDFERVVRIPLTHPRTAAPGARARARASESARESKRENHRVARRGHGTHNAAHAHIESLFSKLHIQH